jgi:hypothetical protein
MQTIVRKDSAGIADRPQTQSTYLGQEPESIAAGLDTPIERHGPTTNSVWALARIADRPQQLPSLMVGDCRRYAIGELTHFNRRLRAYRNIAMHCDFSSVPMPDISYALNLIRCAQQQWEEALGHQVISDELADITYADVDYPPRPRRYLDVKVRIDPNGTRVPRRYTDSDAEVWGP